jgi:hypothetical protein
MKVRRVFCALALSSITVIGVAAPASAVTSTTPVTRTSTTLDCVGSHPVHATALLTARQVTVLQAVVVFINTHPVLFGGTTCTVT